MKTLAILMLWALVACTPPDPEPPWGAGSIGGEVIRDIEGIRVIDEWLLAWGVETIREPVSERSYFALVCFEVELDSARQYLVVEAYRLDRAGSAWERRAGIADDFIAGTAHIIRGYKVFSQRPSTTDVLAYAGWQLTRTHSEARTYYSDIMSKGWMSATRDAPPVYLKND